MVSRAREPSELELLIEEAETTSMFLARKFNISYRVLNSWKYGEVKPEPKKYSLIICYLKDLIELNKKYD